MEGRVAIDGRLLRRHDAVGQRVEAGDRHRQHLRAPHPARVQVRVLRAGAHRVRDEAVERLHERGRLAARGIDRDRAAERDRAAHALGRHVGAVHREHAPQAPADQAHLAPALVVHVADLLLERVRVAAAKADVAPEAPGLDLVAAALQEELERDHRRLVGHEAGEEQHRVAVAARRAREQRQVPRERGRLEQPPAFGQLVDQVGLAHVGVTGGHERSRKSMQTCRADQYIGPCERRRRAGRVFSRAPACVRTGRAFPGLASTIRGNAAGRDGPSRAGRVSHP